MIMVMWKLAQCFPRLSVPPLRSGTPSTKDVEAASAWAGGQMVDLGSLDRKNIMSKMWKPEKTYWTS